MWFKSPFGVFAIGCRAGAATVLRLPGTGVPGLG
jgi:hypothetical protein